MKYLSKLLSMLLVGAMLYSTGCTDYAEDIKNVDNRVDQEVATLTGALQQAIKEAQEANKALQAEIDALETQLAGVETELTGVMSDLDQAKKDLADLQSKAATKEELAALESKVATKTQLAEDLAKLKTELESKIGGVEARVDANQEAIETIQSFVTNFNGDLTNAGYEKFADVLVALNTLKANFDQHLIDFENYKDEAAKDLADAVTKLEGAIDTAVDELKKELVEKIETADANLQGQIDTIVGKLDPALEDITALKNDMTDVLTRLQKAEESIESHAGLIATAQKDIEDLKGDIEDLQGQIDDTNDALEAAKTEVVALLNTKIEELQGQINTTNDNLETLTKKVDTLRTDFDEFKEEVEAELKALTENVKRLLNRIQSVVYVPEYTDGKITVKNVTFGNDVASMVLCGYAKVQYDIYPAYAAEALVNSYEEGMLSFNHQELQTRAADAFKILAVNYEGNGRVELEVLISNSVLATENDAVSLVVNAPEGDETAAANLSSCYAQLYYAKNEDPAFNVSMNLYDENEVITDKEFEAEKPYDSKDFKAEGGYSYRPFEGYTLGFVLSNDNTKKVWSYEALQAIYPELPKPVYTGDNVASIEFKREGEKFESEYLKGIFEEDANEPGINVSKNDKTYIGVSSEFGISYSWSDYVVAANATFTIVKGSSADVIYELTKPFEFKWNYDLDAVVDAARIGREGYEDMTYTRNDLKINVAELAKVSDTELPVDVKLAEVLAFAPDSVDVNGVEVSSLADGKLTFDFDGFEWGKEYTVSANYGLNHVDETFGDAIVTVKFYVETVDRERDLITFTYEPVSDVYRSNFVKTYTDKISFAGYQAYFPGKDVDEFADDVLYAHKYDVTSNTVNDVAATEGTMLDIVEDKIINVKYNYADDDITVKDGLVVRDLAYSKEITLWYGQKVKFIKNVTFNEPTYWFKRVPNYVYDVRNESGIVVGYATDVQPNYTPDSKPTTALSAFDVNAVDLDAAFDLMDSEFNIMTVPVNVDENRGVVVAANGDVLKPVFRLTDVQDAGITIADNTISYYGADKFVNVDANIHLCNDNGSVMILGTNFDGPFADVEDYSDYIVNQYDPIGDITSTNHVEPVIEWGDYTVDLTNLFSMKDRRGVEMINQGRVYGQRYLVEGYQSPFGGNNGFKQGYYAGDIYGHYVNGELVPVDVKFTYGGSDAAQLENKGLLEYMPSGKIVFHYLSENDLKRDIKINVVMNVTTAWGVHSKGATVTFTKSAYTAK